MVVKVPRFAFEKFPQADPVLTTTMKSVGEVMAIGRTFKEALGKAMRSLERPGFDLGADGPVTPPGIAGAGTDHLLDDLRKPSEPRLLLIERALAAGSSVDEVAAETSIDPWFIDQIGQIVEAQRPLRGKDLDAATRRIQDESCE